MTLMYPLNMSMLQEPAVVAKVGPDQVGLPGCAGHVAALDRQDGVVDGSWMEGSVHAFSGNPNISVRNDTSPAFANVTYSEDTPWSTSGAALPVSQQCWDSLTRPWHTAGQP